ncbi:hypothetical protein E2C01_028051 [Portunus trituberculatus]|uniref:Uncharacterized protein n=1 Tax=Portunus trituberculatus TaxID=210409 RepID=A0A5B7EML2_PORTR|nr:hypothetical protein [Portunus trituberculatus]
MNSFHVALWCRGREGCGGVLVMVPSWGGGGGMAGTHWSSLHPDPPPHLITSMHHATGPLTIDCGTSLLPGGHGSRGSDASRLPRTLPCFSPSSPQPGQQLTLSSAVTEGSGTG